MLTLPLSPKEVENKCRTRIGRHVFLSRYYYDFTLMSEDAQFALLPNNQYDRTNIIQEHEDDLESVESLQSVETLPKIPPWVILKLASQKWRLLPVKHKQKMESTSMQSK